MPSSFKPENLLPIAAHLEGAPGTLDQLACLRTSLNRAYYGPLLYVKWKVEQTQGGNPIGETGTHKKIISALQASRVGAFLKAVEALKILRTAREKADYDLGNGEHQEPDAVSLHLKRAVKLQALLESTPDPRYKNLKFG